MPPQQTFQPQPLNAPLNDKARMALSELAQAKQSQKKLQEFIKKSTEQLTAVAGQLNDRGTEESTRHAKKMVRLRSDGMEESAEERRQFHTFQQRVETLTRKMDSTIQKVIDSEAWLRDLPEIFNTIAGRSASASQATQRLTQGPTPLPSTQRRRNRRVEDEEDEDEDVEMEEPEENAELEHNPSLAPSVLLNSSLAQRSTSYSGRSLTDRYATCNEYIGFYRTVYDARNPLDNAPPIPHHTLWFAEEESGVSSFEPGHPRNGHSQPGLDNDIQIASERVRVKCPITFLYFVEPYKSIKCPHAFEKSAILQMIHRSSRHLPFSDSQNQELSQLTRGVRQAKERQFAVKAVECPECNVLIAEADLRPDPVLKRKVQRIVEAERRREAGPQEGMTSDIDEYDDDDKVPGGSQSKPVGLGSSPAPPPSRSTMRSLKSEAMSGRQKNLVPSSQSPRASQLLRSSTTSQGAMVVDLESDEDENGSAEDESSSGSKDEDIEEMDET